MNSYKSLMRTSNFILFTNTSQQDYIMKNLIDNVKSCKYAVEEFYLISL